MGATPACMAKQAIERTQQMGFGISGRLDPLAP
jgi:hypothetical protein